MTDEPFGRAPVEAPLSGLERSMIDEFVRMRGYDPQRLQELAPAERDVLLKEASLYASAKLAEIESRAHYVQEMHENREDSEK